MKTILSGNNFKKLILLSFIILLNILKINAQDRIIKKTGQTIICKITNVDSTKIMFKMEKYGKVINTYMLIEDISEYRIEKSYKESIHDLSDYELDAALSYNKKFIRKNVAYATLFGPIFIGLGFISHKQSGGIFGVFSYSVGAICITVGTIKIPIGIIEKHNLNGELKKRQTGSLYIAPTKNGIGLVYNF